MYNNNEKLTKVLFCHGLGGDGLSNRKLLGIFRKLGIDMISPTVDHQFFINNPYIFNTMVELAKDVDVIVGNSMGGYFAYHLGKATGKPSLCFNPAISEITTSYCWFNNVTNYKPIQNDSLIYMATDDDVVDHNEGKKFIKSNGFNDEIRYLMGETHNLTFDLIIDKMVEFINNVKINS